jgi:hypothetical protein
MERVMYRNGLVVVLFFTEGDIELLENRGRHASTDPSKDGLGGGGG